MQRKWISLRCTRYVGADLTNEAQGVQVLKTKRCDLIGVETPSASLVAKHEYPRLPKPIPSVRTRFSLISSGNSLTAEADGRVRSVCNACMLLLKPCAGPTHDGFVTAASAGYFISRNKCKTYFRGAKQANSSCLPGCSHAHAHEQTQFRYVTVLIAIEEHVVWQRCLGPSSKYCDNFARIAPRHKSGGWLILG